MAEPATISKTASAWPMTAEAWDALAAEVGRLRRDISLLAGDGLEEGVTNLEVSQAARRLETLLAAQRRAEVIDDEECAAIGRRATLREPDGEVVSYSIVFPGDGDPAQGWISADSPLGAAILRARPGEVVEVAAPAGRWSVSLVAVE